MKARMMVEKPDEIEMTVKLTMKMKDWEALREQLADAHPAWKLSMAITDMLMSARKVFYAEQDKEGA